MGLFGIVLGVALAGGILLSFVGIVVFSLTIAAPFAFRANMLGVAEWTRDHFDFVPGVAGEREYAGMAVFTVITALTGVALAALGGFLLALPGLVR